MTCACGCGREIVARAGHRPREFSSAACRQRAYRARLAERASAKAKHIARLRVAPVRDLAELLEQAHAAALEGDAVLLRVRGRVITLSPAEIAALGDQRPSQMDARATRAARTLLRLLHNPSVGLDTLMPEGEFEALTTFLTEIGGQGSSTGLNALIPLS